MTYPLFIRSILSLLLIAALSSPALAVLYSWRDAEGVLHATDRRDKVPEGVTPEVWPDLPPSPPAEAHQVLPPQPKAQPLPSQEFLPAAEVEAGEVTQGAFAVQLVRELGLEEDADPEEAADLLTRMRVTPRLGRWELSAPITPALVSRLRTLTVSAAQRGAISIGPEEALLAFDTTAALLNVSIPAEADLSDRSASSTYLDAPPLVLISPPPPQIVSFYVWVPVEDGFFWSGSRRHGFYVLHEVHRDLHFNGHRFAFRRHYIERRFTNRFYNDPFIDRRGFNVFPPFHDRRPPVIVLPPPIIHPPHLPPPPRRHDRTLRGGSRSTGRPTIRSMPPSAMTPLAPPVGETALTPLAPRLRGRSSAPPSALTPLAPRVPQEPQEPPAASVPRPSLRGR
ncbi:MAG: DUF4124 domain-containing protein [Candidatus Manganitrophus sp.]|nr:MAG: DUF4124 domain-containing protein [Candidatus Manganitrophus sp.]